MNFLLSQLKLISFDLYCVISVINFNNFLKFCAFISTFLENKQNLLMKITYQANLMQLNIEARVFYLTNFKTHHLFYKDRKLNNFKFYSRMH